MRVFLVTGGNETLLDELNKAAGEVSWRQESKNPDALLALSGGVFNTVVGTVVTSGKHAVVAKQVVTYGLGARETLTLSSTGEDYLLASLQRDIVSLGGARIERQELKLPLCKNQEALLGVSAALLLADYPPSRLAKLPPQMIHAVGALQGLT